ncbi:MAG: SEL1-like repeat protein [Taibaiella sp.]|nr:SEL1-like repeat protein [Taibaiella sp.]
MKFIAFFFSLFLLTFTSFAQLEKPATPTKKELASVRAKAAKGNVESLSLLGQYYYYGLGVARSYPVALKWLNKAAAKSDVASMLLLGEMYEQGMGVAKDLKKSLDWTKKAALKGSSDAAYELAEMYEEGNGVPKDMAESVKWYTIAADKGDVDAMISLGFCYMEGDGVPADRKAGYDWFVKAAEKGESEAMRYLGDYYAQADMGNDCNKAIGWYMKAADAGDSISVKPVGVAVMKDECATVDKYEVAQWMKKHAELNNPEACFYMGGFYVMGIGVKKNPGKGMEMLIKDRELGAYTGDERNFSTNNLFTLYNSGELGAEQQQRLLRWFETTAKADMDDEMMAVLANIYINKEKASAMDNRTALDWATRSAEMGNPNGCFWLGYIYYKGLGEIKKNDGRAFLWMLKSAQKGDKDAMKIVSELYEYGIGTERSSKKAAEWAAKAKEI